MRLRIFTGIILALLIWCNRTSGQTTQDDKMILRDNWSIQSSDSIKEDGKALSQPDLKTDNWYAATMPSTVLAALVKDNVYPDPYFGTNIQSLPGYFSQRRGETPPNSPFRVSWWYRTIFSLPDTYRGKETWLKLHSINYRANIWINGKLVADTSSIEGAYRLYDLKITGAVRPGEKNCLAIEIFPPKPNDLTITWVDWNPTPPDRGMGIWYDMYVHSTGPVSVVDPRIVTRLNLPSANLARLTVSADIRNNSTEKITGTLTGTIGSITFSEQLTLAPNETIKYTADPGKFKQLEISDPKLWWPYTMGPQNLYDLDLVFETQGRVSDSKNIRFGIREVTSWMNYFDKKVTRVFQINGRNLVIRGGGYVEDMMLRPSDRRIDIDLMYLKHMGLNALRMEAPRGSDYIFNKCDEEGILVMVGWCCCSTWENWNKWTPHITDVAEQSWTDQITRLRNHPSVFDWLYGSDNFPPANVEKIYIKVLDEKDGTRPYQSSATRDSSAIAGRTGLWMGPYPNVYAYYPPSYWYTKLEYNTEAGPGGEQMSPIESMRKMMPAEDLWPIGKSWDIRLHRAFYPQARQALKSRYGEPAGPEEYIMKSQVLQYEATRGMFEAFAGNKYKSSGIIYWMYNSAWPKLYWQFYDFFFTPNGSLYGARKACQPLHVQYAYDNKSVMIVNGLYQDFKKLRVKAKIYDINMTLKYSKEFKTDVKSDESKRIDLQGMPGNLTGVWFLKLELLSRSGKLLSDNFYWLSDKGDDKADFTALNNLPKTEINCKVAEIRNDGVKTRVLLDVANKSATLAFFINPKILRKTSGDLVTPVFWSDNYFSLLPGEKKQVSAEFFNSDLGGEIPVFTVEGWNIQGKELIAP